MRTYSLEYRSATAEEESAAKACLKEHTTNSGVDLDRWSTEQFSVLARCENRVVGGLVGRLVGNWVYADLVWVEENFRGSGIGRDVMVMAEEKARENGLTGIYLWTASWQAPGFYSKLGFEQFAVFDNFPPGHRRIGFRKYL